MKSGNRAARLVRIALLVALGVAGIVCIPFLAAGRSEVAWRTAFHMTVFVKRALRLPDALRHRDRRCSIAQAWRASVSSEYILQHRRLTAASRILQTEGDTQIVGTPIGAFCIPARDTPALIDEIVEEEAGIYAGRRGVRAGDIVLDCGANVGVFTRESLNRGAKLVVAIEPSPECLRCLRRRFSREIQDGRVILYPKGVWDRDAELELSTSPGLASAASSVALTRGNSTVRVPLTTVDALVQELKLERVDFIKMDIEGAEQPALRGAVNSVARFRPAMAITLEHRPSDADEIPALIRTLWPQYEVQCGRCVFREDGMLRPDILFAY
jgi:FkbM family methyltransferase